MNKIIVQKGGILLLCASVVIGALWLFWIWANIVQNNFGFIVEQSAYGQSEQQEKIQEMRTELRNARDSLTRMHALTIKESHIPELLNRIESIGTDDNPLFVKSVDASAQVVMISVSVSGTWAKNMEMVQDIMAMPYAVYIASFEARERKHLEESISNEKRWDISMRLGIPLLPPLLDAEQDK